MFENFLQSDVCNEVFGKEKLELTNPMHHYTTKQQDKCWDKLRAFVEDYLKDSARFYKEEDGYAYAESMRQDKIPATICEDPEFVKIMEEIMEWTI